ncbi:MAG: hypothetical protein LLF83_09275 [Methanobacterium sp.]|nr:hypothetical protein [Methanobacterium sp.]
MMDKDEMIDLIVTTPIEKIEGPDDVWESHIDLDDDKTLIVGYKGEENYCEEVTEEECLVTYSWYWELRNSESWELIQENHDSDLTFCTPSQKEPWSDESTFEEVGDLSSSKICTWSDQNHIEDIAEDIVDEITEWMDND